MKRALLVVVAALTACGGAGKIDPTQARNALPDSAAVQIATPADSSSQALTAGGSTSLSSVQSGAYELTRDVAGTVNLGVGVWIGLLEYVVSLPPTSCTPEACTWGPYPETNPLKPPASYQLTVTKDSDSQYSYKFSAAPGTTSSFVDIVSGSVKPNGVPHHGEGSFTVDFDAGRAINPASTDTGTLLVTHSNIAGLQIQETLTGGTDQNGDHKGQTLNAVYAFDQTATGGDLQVGLHYPVTTTQPTDIRFTVHSRWDSTGAGRADYTYQAPSSNEASECWGARSDTPIPFDLTYQEYNGVVVTGAVSQCVYLTAVPITATVP
jgi:hypothetical protein